MTSTVKVLNVISGKDDLQENAVDAEHSSRLRGVGSHAVLERLEIQ